MGSSLSASTSSRTSKMSVDGQLKEFKKKIMENNEPSQISLIRKILCIMMIIVLFLTSFIYSMNIKSYKDVEFIIN